MGTQRSGHYALSAWDRPRSRACGAFASSDVRFLVFPNDILAFVLVGNSSFVLRLPFSKITYVSRYGIWRNGEGRIVDLCLSRVPCSSPWYFRYTLQETGTNYMGIWFSEIATLLSPELRNALQYRYAPSQRIHRYLITTHPAPSHLIQYSRLAMWLSSALNA